MFQIFHSKRSPLRRGENPAPITFVLCRETQFSRWTQHLMIHSVSLIQQWGSRIILGIFGDRCSFCCFPRHVRLNPSSGDSCALHHSQSEKRKGLKECRIEQDALTNYSLRNDWNLNQTSVMNVPSRIWYNDRCVCGKYARKNFDCKELKKEVGGSSLKTL